MLTTDSHHPFAIYPNLVPRLVVNSINQLWVADITYIRLRETFLYLAVILDAHSRKAVGWELGNTLEASLAVAALQRAIADRAIEPGIVHHSDRGVQYASGDYVALLEANGIDISMSRKGNPWDKAYASYCTPAGTVEDRSPGKRRRLASLTPWALHGGLGSGSSYNQSFRSFTG